MSGSESDAGFDALLKRALAPPDRGPDAGFVARVDRAIVERDRYRRQRASLRRQLGGEVLALAALVGSIYTISHIPGIRAALSEAPILAWPALLSLIFFWLVVTRMQRLPA
jgi:hypothetical protein